MSNNITLDNLYDSGLSKFQNDLQNKIFNLNNIEISENDIINTFTNLCTSILNNHNINLIQFDMILSKMICKNINQGSF